MAIKVGDKVKIKIEGLDFDGMFEESKEYILNNPNEVYEVKEIDNFFGFPIELSIEGVSTGFAESELILVGEL